MVKRYYASGQQVAARTADETLYYHVNDPTGTSLVMVDETTGELVFEVTSGPGEFPTGPSITFSPPGNGTASKISILDGQAAIEFRTYYSGTSVITASSPGLASDTVTITSQGSPEFVEGQTPPADTVACPRAGSAPPRTAGCPVT